MPARSLLPLAATVLMASALLTGCVPGALVADPSAASGSPEASPSASDPADSFAVPPDAVLVLEGVATAANGAVADFRLVVHASTPYDADTAADAVLATETWCVGEHDITTISAQEYSFTDVDVSLIVREDSDAWPAEVPLLVWPLPSDASTLAVSVPGETLHQVDEHLVTEPIASVPHCVQPALLDGPGEGVLHLGLAGDKTGATGGDPLTAWAEHEYGLDSNLPGSLGTSAVVFSDCEAVVTPLGNDLGAQNATWLETFDSTLCIVGGTAGP